MSDKLPKVSIVIPAYNEGNNILACVTSLKRQDFPKGDYEIIVIDNNSTDNTLELIRKLSVIYTVEYKKGPAAAKNAGITLANGNIIAFIDGDCVATKDWIKNIVSGFDESDVGCVAGSITAMEDANLSPLERFLIRKGHLSQVQHIENSFLPFAATANAAYRKDVLDRIGLFDEGLPIGEDADLSWRMQLFTDYKVRYAPDAAVFHPYESRPKELFRQKRRHAFGSVMLYKKYRHCRRDEVKDLKQTYWEYVSIVKRWVKLFLYKLQGAPDSSPVNEYQLLLETAQKVGLIHGSLRHRVWYV
jgi:cellulose synthase/poly-beta-1,6-N-acetylglucosamine synthase-like glycosyltransferase